MKILSIGLYGIPSAKKADLISANVLQDYEAVVVNPNDLSTLYGEYIGSIFAKRDPDILTNKFASFANKVNADRRKQVKGLIQKKVQSYASCNPFGFGNPLMNLYWYQITIGCLILVKSLHNLAT